MKIKHELRVTAGLAVLMGACLSMTGCASSPTYGTDKTAAEQLVTDLGEAIALAPEKKKPIGYTPRPGLVLPKDPQHAQLSTPQPSMAGKESEQWVESPEETRARLVAEADANKNRTNYRSPLATAGTNARSLSLKEQNAAYRAARMEQKGAYDERRFLSDPPTQYRQAADPTALDDLGEPEKKKEKRRKKMAASEKQSSSWWSPFQ